MIKIKQSIYDEIVAHAKDIDPVECCGYLAGKDGEITRIFKMTNIDNSPEHFTFDPKEQFAVVKQARSEGLTLLSVYHSHPESPARLSEEDIRLLNDPNMVYLIVSLMDDTKADVKGFRIEKPVPNEVRVMKVEIEIS